MNRYYLLARLFFYADSALMHADATAMPDAVEIIFQSALEFGRHGGVSEALPLPSQKILLPLFYLSCIYLICFISDLKWQVDEMMGKVAIAVSRYTKAICMLRFLLIEAPSLALNPPLSLTRSDRHRLRSYIEALNTRLSQLQCQGN
jgi:serine/threonine-protein kinase ULK/ATG1